MRELEKVLLYINDLSGHLFKKKGFKHLNFSKIEKDKRTDLFRETTPFTRK